MNNIPTATSVSPTPTPTVSVSPAPTPKSDTNIIIGSEAVLGAGAALLIAIVTAAVAYGKLRGTVDSISTIVKGLADDMKDIRERFATFEGKNAGLFKAQSPISLTPAGEKFLQESGLKLYIDENKEELQQMCEGDREFTTAYDVQEYTFEFMDSYKFPALTLSELKQYSFSNGISIDVLRRVGALYLRDVILAEKGYDPKELDK